MPATTRPLLLLLAAATLATACAVDATGGGVGEVIITDPVGAVVPSPSASASTSASTSTTVTRHNEPAPLIPPIDHTWQSCPPRKWVESTIDTSNPDFPVSSTGTRLVPMADGRVMAIDGDAMFGEVAVYDPKRDEYLYAPGMTKAHGVHSVPFIPDGRSREAVVAMPDGTVMLIGGNNYRLDAPGTEVDVIDPRTWTLRKVAPMHQGRYGELSPIHGILLPNGKVMAFGGSGPEHVVEIYDPATDTWTDSPTPASMFPADGGDSGDVPKLVTLTANGKLLAFGRSSYAACGHLFIYDVAIDRWREGPPMPLLKEPDAAVLLLDGRVMAVGGNTCFAGDGTHEVDFFDPRTEAWSTGAPLPQGRNYSYAQVLPCGSVLVHGGVGATPDLVELYDPSLDAWSEPLPPMYRKGEASALLADGTFVIAYTGTGPRRRMVMLH